MTPMFAGTRRRCLSRLRNGFCTQLRDPRSKIQDARFKIQDPGFKIQDAGKEPLRLGRMADLASCDLYLGSVWDGCEFLIPKFLEPLAKIRDRAPKRLFRDFLILIMPIESIG
jgi:hypothetical protein